MDTGNPGEVTKEWVQCVLNSNYVRRIEDGEKTYTLCGGKSWDFMILFLCIDLTQNLLQTMNLDPSARNRCRTMWNFYTVKLNPLYFMHIVHNSSFSSNNLDQFSCSLCFQSETFTHVVKLRLSEFPYHYYMYQ